MRFILKLFAVPLALVFTVAAAFFTFVLSASELIFNIASGLVFIVAVVLFITGEPLGGAAFIAIAFLISPVGLPAFGLKLAEALANTGGRLRGFIFS